MKNYFKQKFVKIKLVRENFKIGARIKSPKEVMKAVQETIQDLDREHFIAIYLDASNDIVAIQTVAIGTSEAVLVGPREVFKAALLSNACRIILIHNHCSSNLEPSEEDIAVTKNLAEAGKLLNIEILDHIIVCPKGKFTSLKSKGVF